MKATREDWDHLMVRLALADPDGPGPVATDPTATAMSTEAHLEATPNAPPQKASLSGFFGAMLSSFNGGNGNSGAQHDEYGVDYPAVPLSHALVMFTATWCGPCAVVYKELAALKAMMQGRPPLTVLVLDVEQNADLASELGIKALPTLLYFGPSGSRGPVFSQGPVSRSFMLDALERAEGFGGRDVTRKWLKL